MQAGFTPEGLPVGVELFGRPMDDAKLVSMAFAFEQTTHHRKAPALTPALGMRTRVPVMTWQSSTTAPGSSRRVVAKYVFDPTTNELKYDVTGKRIPGQRYFFQRRFIGS